VHPRIFRELPENSESVASLLETSGGVNKRRQHGRISHG
jgi:hypothetical protein